jgi:hypothetical protein
MSVMAGCARSPRAVPAPGQPRQPVEVGEAAAIDAFWANLQQHCGRAFPGGLGVEPPGDDMLQGDELLIAHFRDCSAREMRIAFHIEPGGDRSADRSRTWVLRRIEERIELRHDHRHQDGTADETTWYGAFSSGMAAPNRMEFEFVDGAPMPGVWRGWRLEIEPNQRYSYGTVRNGEWRWRVDFDLSRPVDLPPPAWGHRAPGDTMRAAPQGAAAPAAAAGPPTTDIHLVPLMRRDGRLQFGEPRNITSRAGYDNQPSFTPDSRAVYYTSIRADGQADIYRYDIASGSAVRFTSTPESEYSPTVMPDGRGLSTVRVESDSAQRLWRFPLDGGSPALVLERIAPVGYHAWGDAHTLALFVLGAPATLRLADTRTGNARIIASDVGRALQRMPGSDTITYMVRVPPDQWRVAGMDFRTGGSRHMTVALEGSQDFAWTPDGTLLMARRNTVYAWRPGTEGWTEAGRFDAPALQRITRMAVSPDGATLAVVSER